METSLKQKIGAEPVISRKTSSGVTNKPSVKSYGGGMIRTGIDKNKNPYIEIALKDKARDIIIKKLESSIKKFRKQYDKIGDEVDELEDKVNDLSDKVKDINIGYLGPLDHIIMNMEEEIKALKSNEEREE